MRKFTDAEFQRNRDKAVRAIESRRNSTNETEALIIASKKLIGESQRLLIEVDQRVGGV